MPRRKWATQVARASAVVWVSSVALLNSAGCRSQSSSSDDGACRVRGCVRRASVALLSGADATSAQRICGGVVVSQSESTTLVLTAAHCDGSRHRPQSQLFVRPDCAPEARLAATAVNPHPLFRPGDPDSGYDFAVVSVPRIACALSVELAPRREYAGAIVHLANEGAWQALRVPSSTALRLRLAREDDSLCRGSSGVPLFSEGPAGVELVGLVSGGRGDCRGLLQAGRVDALPVAFLSTEPLPRREDLLRSQTCAQCGEQLALGAGRCGNAAAQCARDADCSRAVACVAACRSVDCERSCLSTNPTSSELLTLMRCTCAAGCSEPCAAHCRR